MHPSERMPDSTPFLADLLDAATTLTLLLQILKYYSERNMQVSLDCNENAMSLVLDSTYIVDAVADYNDFTRTDIPYRIFLSRELYFELKLTQRLLYPGMVD